MSMDLVGEGEVGLGGLEPARRLEQQLLLHRRLVRRPHLPARLKRASVNQVEACVR
jgi:hypothetical protein